MKQKIFSITREDCDWFYYRGSGKGGQNRNKTDTAVRVVHRASQAVGTAQDERSQLQNKRLAFKRMAATEKFKNWVKVETARRSGMKILSEEELQQKVKEEMKHILVEYKKNNEWEKEEDE